MKHSDKLNINRLLHHCDMFRYACDGSPEFRMNPIASDFFQFGLLHLTSTLFITEGGMFHRILDPMGHSTLLRRVDAALDSKVGKTTLRQFVRSKRNKLATHGDLSFASQPREIQKVTYSRRALQQFEQAMTSLEAAVLALAHELEKMMKPKKHRKA